MEEENGMTEAEARLKIEDFTEKVLMVKQYAVAMRIT